MKFLGSQRFLVAYSGILTLVFAVTVLCGFSALRNPQFGTITAHRLDIVEPDGTVRLVISNRADFPGAWVRGQEYPRPDRRDAAGMLFMSEEGTEQGGFIWGAGQQPDGTVQNHLHLSFDQYEANQVFAIDAGQEGPDKFSRLAIIDQGDYPASERREAFDRIMKLPAQQQDAAWKEFFATHAHDRKRLLLGRAPDGSVGLDLKDASGRTRAQLAVDPDGTPVLRFLDQDGKVTNQFTPEKK